VLGGFIDFRTLYSFAADAILITHVLFVAFVAFGLILVYAGFFLKWQWVRNVWFRSVHPAATGVIVLRSWFGVICPLTTGEMGLRANRWLNRMVNQSVSPALKPLDPRTAAAKQ
jgi:hypothetical protein